ncbi:MAG: arginine--tRNA ligase [Planctomycetes bacterium]|nr:arginine--tRNA ligase [Planctomycetota bacterium]
MSESTPHGLAIFAQRVTDAVAAALQLPADQIQLERPRNEEHGEFAMPCFRFAKVQKCNPAELAGRLVSDLNIADVTASNIGPFLNFRIDDLALATQMAADARREDFGKGLSSERTLVEYSSPNIAKPMHIGHLRTTVIGAALARIFEFLGHDVVRINHIGDWGSQFGKLLAAWRRWGSDEKLEAEPIAHLLELYVRYHAEEKTDPSLDAAAKDEFLALESGEENDARRDWKHFTELSLGEFKTTFERLDARFDLIRGESWYEDKLEDLVQWLDAAGVLEWNDGAIIVDLESEGISTPCLVKTSRGTTLYATRDLAAAKSRWDEFHFDRCLYVVGAEQSLHFKQFKAVLKRCGTDWWNRIEHIPFGLVRFTEGKLSTREGRVLSLQDVLDRAVELAREIVEAKNPDHVDKDWVAEQVGIGAVVFHDLKHQRQKDVVFNWNEVLSFEGDTGPYLQYTHARCCSILRKADRQITDVDPALLADARDLWVALGRFPAAVREAAEKREPMLLAQTLLKIAAAGNSFYREKRVLGNDDPVLENARLAAIDGLRNTLAHGLMLLGVPTPEEM